MTLAVEGAQLGATLTAPAGRVRGGLVPLHPAAYASRRQFLFDHLAELLPAHGVAVLRFDRRPAPAGDDVPFALQAADALAALETLRAEPEIGEAPLGLWAWSQGAWAAPLAAAWSVEVGFLVLVAGAGVSPAEQMRYGTAEQLRRAGYGAEALSELAELRSACERVLRGDGGLAEAQTTIDRFAERPWFSLAYLPRTIPPEARWTDIDFDPEPVFEQVRCPVLLFYGEHDEWTPIDATLAAWSRAGAVSANDAVRVVRLAGADHAPTIGGRLEASAISPAYEQALLGWLDEILPSGRRAVG